MKHRARTSSPARRAYYDAASYRRWVARQIGPRCVGGIYRSGYSDSVYEVLAIDPGPREGWPTWRITVRTLGEDMTRWHCTAWDADHDHDQVVAEPGVQALRVWVEHTLTRPASSGALLEQRHVLDEAAHPGTVGALYELARAARIPSKA
ncbi:hypothetical protein GCM10010441_44640 [Kitasatospora paracochleata]|uniref:Polyketide cyclase / dehydrase and lipid transport n=1 Tax=Kitasatospora paracochleata TaxID=58354 RepID=A0ABT1JAG5_9ACTN|nr:hypothetical protein [Kitasatospora paracochleata]MCP2314041.1 hypothetical protein [Kitasatospora paracochleata]